MSKHKGMKQAQDKLQAERAKASRQVDRELGDEIARFEAIAPQLRAKRAELEKLGQKLDADLSALTTAREQVEQAGAAVAKIYRDANEQVRDPRKPVPPYFHTPFRLEQTSETFEVDAARAEIAEVHQLINDGESAFRVADEELAGERLAILNQLEAAIEMAEQKGRTQAKAADEAERADREALGVPQEQPRRRKTRGSARRGEAGG
jgi:hypothetical protein